MTRFRAGASRFSIVDPSGNTIEQAMALAALIELSVALGKTGQVPEWGARLRALTVTEPERTQVASFVADPALLGSWWRDPR
ncbi:hypothetical protein [Micromonospora sp. ALFpr18c]|uniref:hypothetical protein n=1 Tax=unclassified Micromonospora TaxID=2617518 RepID=UPI001788C973|nr:hypothetical protein [Micromonospora sp. ALFpr18c]